MKTPRNLLFIAAAGVLAIACAKESSDKKTEQSPSTTAAEPAAAEPTKPTAPPLDIGPVLAEYESIRALLANDSSDGLLERARALESAALAAAKARAETSAAFEELAAAAKKLVDADKNDMQYVRRLFGDVSRPLVGVLERDSSLAPDLHLFECPMAKGFKRWVQPSETLENPYMGQRMLSCGSEVK